MREEVAQLQHKVQAGEEAVRAQEALVAQR